MKKYLLILFLAASFIACKKESNSNGNIAGKTCWYCTFGQTPYGDQPPPKVVCNDGEAPSGFKDEEGNDLSSFCKKQ
jgi:hypothetical protein